MGNPTMWFEVATKDRDAMKGFCGGPEGHVIGLMSMSGAG